MDLSGLNREQIKAVKHIDGPLLILAGAGSGKTTTMTYRIAYMIEQGVDPFSILAVTFTNKAAAEMRQRVESLVPNVRGMWIMTFHAMCLRVLRYHAASLGYGANFTVYDESDKKSLIKRILKDKNVSEKEYPVSLFVAVISSCKEQELAPDEYLAGTAGDVRSKLIYEVYSAYEAEMMKNNAMDFDDLLLNGVKMLEADAAVLEHYRHRFRYVMVDEYQDTNYIQYKLIKYLATGEATGEGRGRRSRNRGVSGNLCVVGDDDQCIYEWRGADIRNILDFENDFPDVKVIKLEQNYRSDGNILSLANSVIRKNSGRKSKALWTDRGAGEKVTYKRLPDEREEARYIGREIVRLRESEGYNYRDFAVLYRKNAQSRPFEEKFMFARIPYRILAGVKFYERKEIKDVISYLKLVDNPSDDTAMLRVINEPKRGVGPKTLAGIRGYAASCGISIYDALKTDAVIATLSAKPGYEVRAFIDMLDECRSEAENLTIESLYDNILKRSGYLKALEADGTVEADARLENIMEFKSVISEYERELSAAREVGVQTEEEAERAVLAEAGFSIEEESTLGNFLGQMTLRTSGDEDRGDRDEVVMMTLHSAKGLEFPVVFIPGMENGVFPGASAFDEVTKMEEERRLCYVGITRARKRLFLTGAVSRMMYGRSDWSTESMFLDEMDKAFMQGDATQNESRGRTSSSEAAAYTGTYYYRGREHGTADGCGGKPLLKPFDTLTQAKGKVDKRISNEGFDVGDALIHPKFGEGMLLEQDEKTMTVAFDSVGVKKLGKGFVELVKK